MRHRPEWKAGDASPASPAFASVRVRAMRRLATGCLMRQGPACEEGRGSGARAARPAPSDLERVPDAASPPLLSLRVARAAGVRTRDGSGGVSRPRAWKFEGEGEGYHVPAWGVRRRGGVPRVLAWRGSEGEGEMHRVLARCEFERARGEVSRVCVAGIRGRDTLLGGDRPGWRACVVGLGTRREQGWRLVGIARMVGGGARRLRGLACTTRVTCWQSGRERSEVGRSRVRRALGPAQAGPPSGACIRTVRAVRQEPWGPACSEPSPPPHLRRHPPPSPPNPPPRTVPIGLRNALESFPGHPRGMSNPGGQRRPGNSCEWPPAFFSSLGATSARYVKRDVRIPADVRSPARQRGRRYAFTLPDRPRSAGSGRRAHC